MIPPEECCAANRSGASCVLPTEEDAVPRTEAEERSLLCAANRGEESAVLRTDNVAAPNRNLVNLADLVENRSVFDENWGVLDENLCPAGLPAWPAFRPNIIPK